MTIPELMQVPVESRRCTWLQASLRAAIKLEFATIPPYLTALWTIKDQSDQVARTIREVVIEEMLHMGLACNMLVALGDIPELASIAMVPSYPGPLPGDVNPNLTISLKRLTPEQLKTFMDIEYPEEGPVSLRTQAFETIGAFYVALLRAFETEQPKLTSERQRSEPVSGLFTVKGLRDVERAIELIRHQGEGSSTSPEETAGHLAHYYQFREIFVGAKYIRDSMGKWTHSGAVIPMPSVWPMAVIPHGGYLRKNVSDTSIWALIEQFDNVFSTMLYQLQKAWDDPIASFGNGKENDPIFVTMFELSRIAQLLVQEPRPDGMGNYGPCFRFKAT